MRKEITKESMEAEEKRFKALLKKKIKDMTEEEKIFCCIDDDFYYAFREYGITDARVNAMKFDTAFTKFMENYNI